VKTPPRIVALAALALAAVACSQKDPAQEAIDAAEGALAAVYENSQKYLPERYAEVKAELDAGRKAFDEKRYADAIAAVKDVPAHAEALSKGKEIQTAISVKGAGASVRSLGVRRRRTGTGAWCCG
jgi:hypothetical protein